MQGCAVLSVDELGEIRYEIDPLHTVVLYLLQTRRTPTLFSKLVSNPSLLYNTVIIHDTEDCSILTYTGYKI